MTQTHAAAAAAPIDLAPLWAAAENHLAELDAADRADAIAGAMFAGCGCPAVDPDDVCAECLDDWAASLDEPDLDEDPDYLAHLDDLADDERPEDEPDTMANLGLVA